MRVLFDLMHPAQVLFFKDVIGLLRREGHHVLVTARRKDETLELLDQLGIPYVRLSDMHGGLAGMGLELAWRTLRLVQVARRFRPGALVGKAGVSIAAAGRLLGVPSIVFEDTEFASLQIALFAPFATVVCTGMGYGRRFGAREVRYNAPPHLAYTHPRRFQPDAALLRGRGIEPDQPYVVLRLKAWRAIHDRGVRGYAREDLVRLAKCLRPYGRPVVSSETEPLPELADCLSPVPVKDVLHLLAFARLYVGEGSSMAAEAACLGTPAIFLSPASRRGYLDALEARYGHVTTVRTVDEAIGKARDWLATPAMKEKALEARRRLVAECEDPVEFMHGIIRRHAGR
jgi:hypothetical protein